MNNYKENECMKCAAWNAIAKEYGKCGMCGDCFNMYFVPVECNVERLGQPLLREWKNKEDLLEFLPF